jgi:MscS family membrane protein
MARPELLLAAHRAIAVLLLVGSAATLSAGPAAQEPAPDPDRAAPVEKTVAAEPTRDDTVPAGAVRSFLDAARARDWERAARYLDLSDIPAGQRAEAGPSLARRLKVVLDRKLWVETDRLSAEPEGDTEDRLPPGTDRVGTIESERRGAADVLVERVEEDGRAVWRISSSTVRMVPELYDQYGYGKLAEILPEPFFELRLFDVALWQWIGLVLLVGAAGLLAWVACAVLVRVVSAVVSRTSTDLDDRVLEAGLPPVRFALLLLFVLAGSWFLWLPLPAHNFLLQLEKGLAIAAVAWFAMRIVDVFSELMERRLESKGERAAATIVPLGRRTVKVFLFLVAGIALLQNVGFNVTGLIAGLGVGGLAVALAAQKTVENFFGGVSVISDRPVKVGDFCKFSADQVGTIEEIGLRSTRIRTLDRTLVTIPNADFSQRQLENYTLRDRMRIHTILQLRYETTPDQLRWVLAELRKLLLSHPRILPDPARARFVAFGAHSLDVEIFAYVDTQEWDELLKVREDVYLRMMDVVAASGTGFAFPSQTLYLGRDTGVDDERRAESERAVGEWREKNALPFPDFSRETAEELARNKLDWPPRGSHGG